MSEATARLRALFDEFVHLTPDGRQARLSELEGDDARLRQTLSVLLAADDGAEDALRIFEIQASVLERPTADDPLNLLGRTVSHFQVLDLVGVGGMGVVYGAVDEWLGREVALKFPIPVIGATDVVRRRFLREARAASKLDHPNICTVFEAGETEDNLLFLAMARYEGETLREKIRGDPLPVGTVLKIAQQVAAGLEVAHRVGILHLDIKPANLMVTVSGDVKILDFGLARLTEEGAAFAPEAGTRTYMAPEQLRGEVVDGRTDLWSLGVVLWEMLTGELPDREREVGRAHEAADEAISRLRHLRPEVSSTVAASVVRLLEPDPNARFPDARAFLSSSGIGRHLPESDRTRSAGRWASGIGGVGLIALAGVSVASMIGGPPRPETDPEATRLYQRGRYHWTLRTEDGLRRSIEFFEQALELDSAYAEAWAGMSDAYNLLAQYRHIPLDSARHMARVTADRALLMDSTAAAAYTARAEVALMDREWDVAERMYRQAVRLDPDYATGRHFYGWYLTHVGRHDEAVAELERASRADPESAIISGDLTHAYIDARRFEEAEALVRQTLQFMPESPRAHLARFLLAHARGAAADERPDPNSLPEDTDPRARILVLALATGERAAVDSLVRAEIERSGGRNRVHPFSAVFLAGAYANLDEAETALDWLEHAEELGLSSGPLSLYGPMFDPVRADPRFHAVLRRMGLPEPQAALGRSRDEGE